MEPRIGHLRTLSHETIERLAGVASSTVADAMGRTGAMAQRISPLRSPAQLAGFAVTIRCAPNDNLMIHKALEFIEPGAVLVVDTQSSHDVGLFGNNMAIYAARRGARGLVIDGSVRDASALRQLDMSIFCTGAAPASGTKMGSGSVNEPVSCGGLIVCPGDAIVGDDDGVAAIPHQLAEEILEQAERREAMESDQEQAVASDQIPLEILYGPDWVAEAIRRLE